MSGHKPLVLVVDDDPLNAEIVRSSLEEHYQVRCESDAEHALAAAKTTPPDVILMDIMLPGMSGAEACRQLKSRACLEKKVPVVVMSSLEKEYALLYGGRVDCKDYVEKPLDAGQLLSTIRNALKDITS